MREYRTGYFAAPCGANRLRKPGNVRRSIHVAVGQVATGTGKAMLHPFSDSPAYRARLARVSGVNVNHAQSASFAFVSNKALKLPESPSMQSCPDPLPGLDIGADMRQVFHADFARTGTNSFCNDGFTDFVIYMFDMQAFAPRDSAQFAFSCAATVGLKPPAVGKVFIAVVPQLSATPDLASAAGGEIVFTYIYSANATTGNGRCIGQIENKVEAPGALVGNQFRFLRRAVGKQVTLMLPTGERHPDAAIESKQGERIALDRVGALIEIDRSWIESDSRNRFVFNNSIVSFECFIGISYTVNGLAYHLAAERRKRLPHCVIGQVVQGNPVPAAVLNGDRNDGAARTGERLSQSRKRRRLILDCKQLHGYGTLHIGHLKPTETAMQLQNRLLTSPA